MQTVDDCINSSISKLDCELSNLRFHKVAVSLVALTVVRSIGVCLCADDNLTTWFIFRSLKELCKLQVNVIVCKFEKGFWSSSMKACKQENTINSQQDQLFSRERMNYMSYMPSGHCSKLRITSSVLNL